MSVCIGTLLTKPVIDRWGVDFVALLIYPVLQYWRTQAGIQVARKFSPNMCSLTCVLSVPVFLIHMLVPGPATIIATVMSFASQLPLGLLLMRNQDWTACVSLIHFVVFAGAFATLLLSVIL